MKKGLYLIFLSLILIQAFPVATEEEVICPDSNPLNCYPKLFVPSDEWQIVKEGQIIPVGLDIRLDLDSLKREAKLMDNSNEIQRNKNHELVVTDTNSEVESSIGFITGLSKSMLSKTGFPVIENNLVTLIEWSSDREVGVLIAQHIQPFLKLSGLYKDDNDVDTDEYKFGLNMKQYSQVQEMIFRIMSSAFRNNLDAQSVLLNYLNKPSDFLKQLVVKHNGDSNLVIKRKLGLLGSLLNNGVFEKASANAGIEAELLVLYTKINDDSIKYRIMNILEDLQNNKRDISNADEVSEVGDVTLDQKFTELAQEKIIKTKLIESSTSKEILESLINFKRDMKSGFKANKDFLNWLDNQINDEKESNQKAKRNDDDDGRERYLDQLIEMRHEIFGNRLGSRRDYIDEL